MNTTINGELSITLPDGFRPMTADELKRFYSADTDAICGFWDEARHITIAITWNVSNKVLAKIASVKDIVKRIEKVQSRALKSSGYRKEGFFDTTVAGARARGVRFGYTAQGVDHDSEAIAFVHGACCYTLYRTSRTENAQIDAALRDAALASLRFL